MNDDLTPADLENLAPGCVIPPNRTQRNLELLNQINAHHNKGHATGGTVNDTEPEVLLWDHERDDQYIVITTYTWVDEHGDRVDYHSDLELKSHVRALMHGQELEQSHDFNIGVVRDRRLVAVLWIDQVVEADPIVLDEIAREIGLVA